MSEPAEFSETLPAAATRNHVAVVRDEMRRIVAIRRSLHGDIHLAHNGGLTRRVRDPSLDRGVGVMLGGTAYGTDFRGIQALRTREAGYSVARKCLEVQAAAEQRDPTLRSDNGVRLHPDAWSWYVGALGEIEVGRMLDTLGPEWLVLHSVPIGAKTTDVDHLLLGPPGVFTLNTKHHANASVWIGDRAEKVNNTVEHYADRSLSEAGNVERRLGSKVAGSVVVNPLVVLVGVRGIKDSRPEASRRVSFVPATDLVRWLRTLSPVLMPAQLGLLHLAAEEPSTWHVDPRAADSMRVMPRFERLRVEVERLGAGTSARPPVSTVAASTARAGQPTGPLTTPAPHTTSNPPRVLLTVVLAAVALMVSIPAVVFVAMMAGSDPGALGIPAVIVLAVIGLLTNGPTKRRRRRR